MAKLMVEGIKASTVITKSPLPRHQKREKIWPSYVLWSKIVNYILDFQYTRLTRVNKFNNACE